MCVYEVVCVCVCPWAVNPILNISKCFIVSCLAQICETNLCLCMIVCHLCNPPARRPNENKVFFNCVTNGKFLLAMSRWFDALFWIS